MPSTAPSASASALEDGELDAGVDASERDVARARALREAQEFGMLGLISGLDGGGIAFGPGGLGLGLGDGGGFGSGGLGLGGSFGSGGLGTLGRRPHLASIRMGALSVNGRLPPEVVRRVVRQQFGRIRLCYDVGLRSNPALRGRITTKFVIDKDGNVSTAKDGGSDLPDVSVVACVVRAFASVTFPQPEGGIVSVVVPLALSPPSP